MINDVKLNVIMPLKMLLPHIYIIHSNSAVVVFGGKRAADGVWVYVVLTSTQHMHDALHA